MENLEIVLDTKKLEDLQSVTSEPVCVLLEPTVDEINTIIGHLVDGKEYKWIKQNVRRVVMKDGKQLSAKGFSIGQIHEINLARNAKIIELTPTESTLTE